MISYRDLDDSIRLLTARTPNENVCSFKFGLKLASDSSSTLCQAGQLVVTNLLPPVRPLSPWLVQMCTEKKGSSEVQRLLYPDFGDSATEPIDFLRRTKADEYWSYTENKYSGIDASLLLQGESDSHPNIQHQLRAAEALLALRTAREDKSNGPRSISWFRTDPYFAHRNQIVFYISFWIYCEANSSLRSKLTPCVL